MKFVSFTLFVFIAIFILLFLIQMCTLGSIENPDESSSQYWRVDFSTQLVTGYMICVQAYGYHVNLFPTYNSLGSNKSSKNGQKAIAIGIGFSFLIYVSLGMISVYTFGSGLQTSVLTNVNEE